MKKFLCLLLCILMLVPSFSTFASENIQQENMSDSLSKDDENFLGYGYNVTSGKELNRLNLSGFPILNMKDKSWLSYVHVDDGINHSKSSNYVADTAIEMAKSISQAHNAGINSQIFMVSVDISAKFNMSNTVNNIKKERYEYYYYDLIRRKIVIQSNVSELRKHLDPTFENELKSVNSSSDAKTIFSKYGSHLLTGYLLGGRLEATNYRTSETTEIISNNDMDLGGKMGVAIGCVSAGVSYSFSEKYTSHENTETTTSTYQCSTTGGRGVASMTIDHLFTKHDSMIDGAGNYEYSRWINAINNEENLEILSISNGGQAIPVWDLLPASSEYNAARKHLFNAYLELCGDKYEEYCKMYNYFDEISSNNEQTGTLNGYYLNKTADDGRYIVDSNMISINNTNNGEISNLAYADSELFINWNNKDASQKIWKVLSGQNFVDVIDATNGVFKIKSTATGKSFSVGLFKKDDTSKLESEKQIGSSIEFNVITSSYSGGFGTAENPFIISSVKDLETLSNDEKNWDKYFIMSNDIDFSNGNTEYCIGRIENNEKGTIPFKGVFDGNFCTITNYNVVGSDRDAVGIFGQNKGTIKNLFVKDSSITLKDDSGLNTSKMVYVGMIAGQNVGGTVSNCKVDNCQINVTYKFSYDDVFDTTREFSNNTGGLIGASFDGIVEQCCVVNSAINTIYNSSLNYPSTTYVGGLIGHTNKGESQPKIVDCYTASCNINASTVYLLSHEKNITTNVGGLIGNATNSCLTYCITNMDTPLEASLVESWIATNVNKKLPTGDFIGHASDSTIKNCIYKPTFENSTGYGSYNNIETNVDFLKATNDISYDNIYTSIVGSNAWIKDEKTGMPVIASQTFASDIYLEKEKTVVKQGSALDYIDTKVTATTKNGKEHTFTVFTVDKGRYSYQSPVSNEKYPITIFAGGKSITYYLTVTDKDLELLIAELNDRTFIEGETISATDIKVSYADKHGIDIPVDIDSIEIYGPEKLVYGENTIILAYNGYSAIREISVFAQKGLPGEEDINKDEKVDRNDVTALLRYIHFNEPIQSDGDLNQDEKIDIIDVIDLINLLPKNNSNE